MAASTSAPDITATLNNTLILQTDSFQQQFASTMAGYAHVKNMRAIHLGGLKGFQYQYDDAFEGETLAIDLHDPSGHLYAHYSIPGHAYFRSFIQRVRIDAKKKFSFGKACEFGPAGSVTCPWF